MAPAVDIPIKIHYIDYARKKNTICRRRRERQETGMTGRGAG